MAEVPIQYAARSLELMIFEMENALDLRVPLKVEGNIGKSWEEAK